MSAVKKKGRPAKREGRERMEKVYTFRADLETQAAIIKLIAYVDERMPMGAAPGSVQAAAIRHGLLFAASKLAPADPDVKGSREKT